MSSGGGGSGGGSQTVTQTNMPAEAMPYYTEMMDRAVTESNKPYQQYEGQRVAGANPLLNKAYGMANSQQLPGQYGAASDMAYGAASPTAQQTQGYAMMDFAGSAGAGYADPTAAGNAGTAAMQGGINGSTTGRFTDQGVASSYMNPYMQNVVDIQKQQANADFAKGSQSRAAQTAMQGGVGGIGGYRDQILQSEGNKAHMTNLDNIQSAGLKASYDQAMAAYKSDEERKLAAAGQQGQLGKALSDSDLANRNLGLDTSKFLGSLGGQMSDAGRADQAQKLSAANALSGMGEKELEGYNSILKNLGTYGTQQQTQDQAALDTAYQDFLAQRGATREDLTFLNSILRGQNLGSEQIRQGATPNTASQVAGAGLAGLALYNQMSS
jgi:hypothetical protein